LGNISENYSLSMGPWFECKIGSKCQLRALQGVSKNRDSLELKSKRRPALPKHTGINYGGEKKIVKQKLGSIRITKFKHVKQLMKIATRDVLNN
jgi:hypothetical protein